MAAGAYSEFAILGLTYAEDIANAQQDSDEESQAASNEDPSSHQASVGFKKPLDFKAPCICTLEDFIIFSEFSEVTGPIPLLTIPTHIQDDTKFDINTFILKIMSVDYQVHQSGAFSVAEDAQLLQLSVVPDLHVYAHYFTLYDLGARGFVRPFCFAYVSHDAKKLQKQLPKLRDHFLEMAGLIKYNNMKGFLEELATNLSTLKSKQDEYFEIKKLEEEVTAKEETQTPVNLGDTTSHDISILVQQYTELGHLHHVIQSALKENSEIEELLSLWESTVHSSETKEARHFIRRLSDVAPPVPLKFSPIRQLRRLRPVPALSPWGCLAALRGLLGFLQSVDHQCSLQVRLDDVWCCEKITSNLDLRGPTEILQCKKFLRIIQELIFPREGSSQSKVTPEDHDSQFGASGGDSSSFHSACDIQSTPPVSSQLEGASRLSSSSSEESFQEAQGDVEELPWRVCLWDANLEPPPHAMGSELPQLFDGFPRVAHHLVYALLSGRVVVLAGPPGLQERVRVLVRALQPLLPPSRQPASILSWHQGILVRAHLDQHSIIGLCVPERLSVHDMISAVDKNCVSILELSSGQLCGPAYSGVLLSALEPSNLRPLLACCGGGAGRAAALLLVLRATLAEVQAKTLLARSLPHSRSLPGLHGCDLFVVRHLAKLLPS